MPHSGCHTTTVKTWHELQDVLTEHRGWAFRGLCCAEWPLYSALSRYLMDFGVHGDAWRRQEERILRIFKRKAHLLLTHIPEENDSLEWLSLMQHHGAPTRLIDFTWSPYVAVFFALQRATGDAAVWALHAPALKKHADTETYNQFLRNPERMIAIGEPRRMNQRLVAQAGTFVLPGILTEPVEEIVSQEAIVKIVLQAPKMRRDSLEELYHMNITNATLFPGLDGLARSLSYELEYNWEYDPVTLKPKTGRY